MARFSLRLSALAAVAGAGAFLFATASEAAMPMAPLTTGADIVHVAQGCGPGRWRGPGGWCRGPGWRGPGWRGPGWRHCWRGPYGHLHCRWR
ncbi:MAG TPA: hypothetical protein VKU03_07990 [Roseiarcus sp.]|nr:hypothetical protein [Roseiarcus sp.]